MRDRGYYQRPTLSGDTVVFVSEDDLWTVEASGGIARRLTANPGRVNDPVLSPDGSELAFTGRDEGGDEVYLMPAAGGPARRLSFLGARTRVVGWTPDGGSVVFASDTREPFPGHSRLYSVAAGTAAGTQAGTDAAAGTQAGTASGTAAKHAADSVTDPAPHPVDLGVGHAVSIAYGPDGARALARNADELAHWKRYRGGTTGELWVDLDASGAWRRLPHLGGNVARPLWIGGRLYFVSDHEGSGNLYSSRPDGSDLRRHTDHQDYYVRQPMGDGRRVVYQAGADLYLFDPDDDRSTRIDLAYASPRAERQRRFVSADSHLQHAALDSHGDALAVVTRGQAFTLAPFDGPGQQRGDATPGRRRLATFLHDGRVVVVSDEGGEEHLELYASAARTTPERSFAGLDIGHPLELIASPTEARVAISDHSQRLQLVDLDTDRPDAERITLVDESPHDRVRGMAFSPDGAYLAYGVAVRSHASIIRIHHVPSGERFDATEPMLADLGPSFDPDGKYLYFLGQRHLDPVYDEAHFDLGFPRATQPYLITLQADAPDPVHGPVAKPTEAAHEARETGDKSAVAAGTSASAPPPPVRIDRDGITRRLVALPVQGDLFQRVRGVKGKLLYSTLPLEGALDKNLFGTGAPPAKATLHAFDLAKRSSEVVMEGITDFELAADASTLLVRVGNRLRVFPAAGKAPENDKAKAGRDSGWVDLGRLRVSVDPPAEWRQMFRETWRRQRDMFWTANMSGVDWDDVEQRYRPLLERVGTRNEVNDLLWEVQGELGTSHAYIIGGDLRPEPQYPQGHLGADLRYDAASDAYLIIDLVQGDPWDARASSPLVRAGVNAVAGDRLVSIDGTRLSGARPPQPLLVNRAGCEVRLGIAAADGSAEREVVVTTLSDESAGRYRDWVEANRRRVHEASDGRLGYLHVPDMMARGFAEFHRGWLLEQGRDGLIVDVRFNGGGHVSPLLLEKLARRRVAYVVGRHGAPQSFPEGALAGPLVALTNERAGSDGDIFSHLFKLLELGPLIGTRTWGGVVGINVDDGFVDGGMSTQPQAAFWFKDVGWQVENYGTDPTIEVDIPPQDDAAGHDPQLERAIAEGLARLTSNPPVLPDLDQRPDNRPASLAPRR